MKYIIFTLIFASITQFTIVSYSASMVEVYLIDRLDESAERFGEGEIPRPPHWGGYLVLPDRFEFWASGPQRLHDRFAYQLGANQTWTLARLAP